MEEIAKTPKEIVCSMSEMQAHQILAVFEESDGRKNLKAGFSMMFYRQSKSTGPI